MRFITVLLVSLAWPAVGASQQQLENFLENLRTLQASFDQTVESNGRRLPSQKGIFYLQRPGKFRWDYEGDDAQLIVADGKRVWLYDRELEQVSHQSEKTALRGTPAQLLSGDGKVGDYFTVTGNFDADGLAWLTLEPRDSETQVEQIRIAFKGNALAELEMDDKFGQTTRFRFSNVSRNPQLDRALFRFEAPPGVDVWDH